MPGFRHAHTLQHLAQINSDVNVRVDLLESCFRVVSYMNSFWLVHLFVSLALRGGTRGGTSLKGQ